MLCSTLCADLASLPEMHILGLEFTADDQELEHAEIDRMIAEVALQLETQQQTS